MMQAGNETYTHKRTCLLEEWVRVNEEFLSAAENWEEYDHFLGRRDAIIDEIRALDLVYLPSVLPLIAAGDIDRMNSLVRLLSALDSDIANAMRTQRDGTLQAIRSMVKTEKCAQYSYGSLANREAEGRFVDRRE